MDLSKKCPTHPPVLAARGGDLCGDLITLHSVASYEGHNYQSNAVKYPTYIGKVTEVLIIFLKKKQKQENHALDLLHTCYIQVVIFTQFQ